jgi:hypothetical protein
MRIVSLIINFLAIINLVLIILASAGKLPHWYLIIGIAYAIFQLMYSAIRKEGLFKFFI